MDWHIRIRCGGKALKRIEREEPNPLLAKRGIILTPIAFHVAREPTSMKSVGTSERIAPINAELEVIAHNIVCDAEIDRRFKAVELVPPWLVKPRLYSVLDPREYIDSIDSRAHMPG